MARARGWCFTVNNFLEGEVNYISQMDLEELRIKYIIVGREIGENGTRHLQGYLEFENACTLKAMKRLFPRCHAEKRRGSPSEAADYCKKEDPHYIERGTPLEQGKRTDLQKVAEMILLGASTAEVIEESPASFIRYQRGIAALRSETKKHRDREVEPHVEWLYGPTGVGKTRTAVESSQSFYIKDETKWWDGYDQQETIIIDDFDGKWPFRNFLRLLDRYPYQGEVKGGTVKINSPRIVITCEFHPTQFWSGNEFRQVYRRLKAVFCLRADCNDLENEIDEVE